MAKAKRNPRAITVYVDNNDICVTEFSWLWKSWLMWEINKEWDLIACVHPEIEERIKKEFKADGLVVLPTPPMRDIDKFWEDYRFVNSFCMFEHDPNIITLSRYQEVFRTDCDTFLTEHFKGFVPYVDKVYFGVGLQHNNHQNPWGIIETRDQVREVAHELKLTYKDISHVGSSIICRTPRLMKITRMHLKVTEYLLKHGWKPGEIGDWPGWFRGVASMYAIDIAVNNYVHLLEIQQGSLDVWCGSNDITKLDMHIHAWPQKQEDLFNKTNFHDGVLTEFKSDKIPTKAGEYCALIACNDIDYLKLLVENNSKS